MTTAMAFLLIFSLFLVSVHSLKLSEFICQSAVYHDYCNVRIARVAQEQKEERTREFTKFDREKRDKREDDPSCPKLKKEYDSICFTPPPAQAFQETKAFCEAFIDSCSESLRTNLFTNIDEIVIDFTEYCKRHKERFHFVCPDPFRFNTYAEDAVHFCARYKDRCPNVVLPDEPIELKDRNEGHIYTREIESGCTAARNFARNYCTDPDLLKVAKYRTPCAVYKYLCIDIYERVIYG